MSAIKTTRDKPGRSTTTLYSASFVTAMTGISAISAAVESAGFFLAASLLAALGYWLSKRLRSQGKNLRIVETIVITICLGTYARLFATGETSPFLSPGIAVNHKELSLAVMLVWAEVVRSFSLISDEALLFSSVPSLALIGVVATASSGLDSLPYFACWLCSTALMFLETTHKKRPARMARPASVAAVIGLASVLAGLFFSPILHTSGMWTFRKLAPSLYSTRNANELWGGDSESNVLQIAKGPVNLTDRVELRVKVDHPGEVTYWRTRVWDDYSGRDWHSTAQMYALQPNEDGHFLITPPVESAKTITISQTFVVKSKLGLYLPVAPEPTQIDFQSQQAVLQTDGFNCWRLPVGPIQQNTVYEVISTIPVYNDEDLKTASQDYGGEFDRYLRLPIGTEEVKALVDRITSGRNNAWDKIQAMRKYLAQNCVYDTETPSIPVTAGDAVSYFLFTSKRGYCDVFASSLAIMARCAGIPARIATGYLAGEIDPSNGDYVVREKDRHSWAEMYFPGYGWIAFEATPDVDTTPLSFWQSVWRETVNTFSGAAGWALLLSSTLLAAVWTLRSAGMTPEKQLEDLRRRCLSSEKKKARAVWRRLAKLMARNGAKVGISTTPSDLARAAEEVFPENAERLKEAVGLCAGFINEVLYSNSDNVALAAEDMGVAWRMVLAEERELRRRR